MSLKLQILNFLKTNFFVSLIALVFAPYVYGWGELIKEVSVDETIPYYGSYNIDSDLAGKAQAELEDILQRLITASKELGKHVPSTVEIKFFNSDSQSSFVSWDHRLDKATIYMSKRHVDLGFEQMVAVIAHELSHTNHAKRLSADDKLRQAQREEIKVADIGGMEIMAKAGYNPAWMPELLENVHEGYFLNEPTLTKLAASAAGIDHPNPEVRVAWSKAWVLENEKVLSDLLTGSQRNQDFNSKAAFEAIRNSSASTKTGYWIADEIPESYKAKQYNWLDIYNLNVGSDEFNALEFDQQLRLLAFMTSSSYTTFFVMKGLFKLDGMSSYEKFINKYQHYTSLSREALGLEIDNADNADRKVLIETLIDEFEKIYNRNKEISPNGFGANATNAINEAMLLLKRGVNEFGNVDEFLLERINNLDTELSGVSSGMGLSDIISKFRSLSKGEGIPYQLMEAYLDFAIKIPDTDELINLHEIVHNIYGENDLNSLYDQSDSPKVEIYVERLIASSIQMGNLKYIPMSLSLLRPLMISDEIKADLLKKYNQMALELLDTNGKLYYEWVLNLHTGNNREVFYNKYIAGQTYTLDQVFQTPDFPEVLESRESTSVTINHHLREMYLRNLEGSSLTMSQINLILENDKFWSEVVFQEVYGVFSKSNFPESVSEDMEKYVDLAKYGQKSPAYKYDIESSEKLQKLLVKYLKNANEYPVDQASLLDLWKSLANRGASGYTDQLLLDEILPKLASKEVVLEILEDGLVWDFRIRQKLFNKFLELNKGYFKSEELESRGNRSEAIDANIEEITKFFPEISWARSEVLESFVNSIDGSYAETQFIEAAKTFGGNENMEGDSIRLFSGLYELIHGADELMGTEKGQNAYQFIRFLIMNEPPPKVLEKIVNKIGPDRIRRVYETLEVRKRAAILAPALEKPRGLLSDEKTTAQVKELLLEGVDIDSAVGNLFLDGLFYTMTREELKQGETASVAALLAAKGGKKKVPVGQVIKDFLEVGLEFSGVAIAQQIVQRRLLPPEELKYLEDAQHRGSTPTRINIYRRLMEVLEIHASEIDSKIEHFEIRGSASTKFVVAVKYASGMEAELDESKLPILKVLHKDIKGAADMETLKLETLQKYLEEHGGKNYARFKGILEDIKEGIYRQFDLEAEANNRDLMVKLYKAGEFNPDIGGTIIIGKTLADRLGAGLEHTHEEQAMGKIFADMNAEERAVFLPVAYAAEKAILLGAPKSGENEISFELDRHFGNVFGRLDEEGRPVVTIIDYPLVTKISVNERDSILTFMGMIYGELNGALAEQTNVPFLRSSMREAVAKTFDQNLSLLFDDQGMSVQQKNKALKGIKNRIELELMDFDPDKFDVANLLLDVLAEGDEQGLKAKKQVHSYMRALNYMMAYDTDGSFLSDITEVTKQTIRKGVSSNGDLKMQLAEKAVQVFNFVKGQVNKNITEAGKVEVKPKGSTPSLPLKGAFNCEIIFQ